ncbi:FtsX-like permease family protein [Priestia koreensis]|uniref:FtsX-like permease family protein n=1 Tax=Priestia koreensis TaxID=284581 RepID=UPI003D07C851
MNMRQLAWNNVRRNFQVYWSYFISSSFSVMIFGLCALFMFHPEIESGTVKEIGKYAMYSAEVIIFIFSFLFVTYSVAAYLRLRSKQLGVLTILGAKPRQIRNMLFLENFLLGLASILFGMGMALLLSKLFYLASGKFLDLNTLSFYMDWKPLVLTMGSFFVLFLVVSMFTPYFVRSKKIIALLSESSKPRHFKKANLFFVLVAIATLGYGYSRAIFINGQLDIVKDFLVIVGLVTIGTYFFFSQFLIFLFQKIQKSQGIKANGERMLTVSGLSFRLKDHARTFFLMTMVLTVAFCSIGTFSAIQSYAENIKSFYPTEINYLSLPGNKNEEKHMNLIRKGIEKDNLTYEAFDGDIRVMQTSVAKTTLVMSGGEFNELRKIQGKKPVDVRSGSVLYYRNFSSTYQGDTVRFYTGNSGIAKTIQSRSNIAPIVANNPNVGAMLVVADADMKEFASIQPDAHYYTYNVKDSQWKDTNNIAPSLMKMTSRSTEYSYTSVGVLYQMVRQAYNVMLLVSSLVGIIFFVTSASFLYFRLFTNFDEDVKQLTILRRIGLSASQQRSIITKQLAFQAFLPLIIAMIHSSVAFVTLQTMYKEYGNIRTELAVVLGCFLMAQVVFFIWLRLHYMGKLNKAMGV